MPLSPAGNVGELIPRGRLLGETRKKARTEDVLGLEWLAGEGECVQCGVIAKRVLVAACGRLGRKDCESLAQQFEVRELAERVLAFIAAEKDAGKAESAAGVLRRFIDVYESDDPEQGGR